MKSTGDQFTNQKHRHVTEKELVANWSGGKKGKYFRCTLCGYKFKLGDYWRWVYANDTPNTFGNFMVCFKCDNENVLEDAVALYAEWQKDCEGKYWNFVRHLEDVY